MRNRRFPYGYEMRDGVIVICKKESENVKRIFSEYLAGDNLKYIAESLTKRMVEYLPGEYSWNKSRIKRMIEDKRYIGRNGYPPLIDESVFQRANAEKRSRRNYEIPTITVENKQLIHMVICGDCGNQFFHKIYNTRKCGERWYCKHESDKLSIQMSISDLEKEITEILNRLITDPTLAVHIEQNISYTPSLAIQRMEHEIERKLESLDFDKNEIQNLILECVAKKYEENKSIQHITDRLKADFEQSSPLSSYSNDLLERTVSAVIMNRDKSIQLKLKNGKIIGKVEGRNDYANRGYAENSQSHSAETGVFR